MTETLTACPDCGRTSHHGWAAPRCIDCGTRRQTDATHAHARFLAETNRLPRSTYRVKETIDGHRHLYREDGKPVGVVVQRGFRGPWILASGRGRRVWMTLREAAEALDRPL